MCRTSFSKILLNIWSFSNLLGESTSPAHTRSSAHSVRKAGARKNLPSSPMTQRKTRTKTLDSDTDSCIIGYLLKKATFSENWTNILPRESNTTEQLAPTWNKFICFHLFNKLNYSNNNRRIIRMPTDGQWHPQRAHKICPCQFP